jgi:large conductance mechanosensitive channel
MENLVGKTSEKFGQIIIYLLDFLKNNLVGFLKFLFDKSIIQTGIGIIIATQISKITDIFVSTIINPIVNKMTMGAVNDVNKWEVTFFDINIKIGVIVSAIINFLSVAFIVYYIWKLSENSSFDFINKMLDESKEGFVKTKTKVIINVPSSFDN